MLKRSVTNTRLAVGRERRLQIGIRILREAVEPACRERHQIQVEQAAAIAADHERSPSGDNAGLNASSSSGSAISRSTWPDRGSSSASDRPARHEPRQASVRPSGLHAPAELRNCRLSKCGSVADSSACAGFPRLRVGEVQLDGEPVPLRKERDVPPSGLTRGPMLKRPAPCLR